EGTITGTTSDPLTYTTQGTHTITWTFDDGNGNVITVDQDVVVNDNTAPTVSSSPSNVNRNVNANSCFATYNPNEPIFIDNCSIVSVNWVITGATNASGNTSIGSRSFNLGTTTITYTATDIGGNTVQDTFTVTVIDNIDPVITCPTPAAQYVTDSNACDYTVINSGLNPTFTDNCSGATIENDYTNTNTLDGASFPVGTTTVVWTVTDASGNIDVCSIDITVVDEQAPIISGCSGDINVNNDSGNCYATVNYSVPSIGSDNCSDATLSQTLGLVSGSQFPIGVTLVEYEAVDASGNTAICSFTVTVVDNEFPTITSLPTLNQDCSVTITTAPTSPDNCGTVTATTGDISLPYTFDIPGTYSVNWNFTDVNGNSKDIIQSIIVTDLNAPVADISNLPNQNFTGCELLESEISFPTATDACNGTIIGVPDIVFPYYVSGTSVVTWTFTDDVGNISTQTQNIVLTAENIDGGVLTGYLLSEGSGTASHEVDITACASGSNIIQMNLAGEVGTIVRWEKYEVGDAIWTEITETNDSYQVTFDAATSESTFYRALVQVGTCYQYSSDFYVRALPPDQAPVLDDTLFEECLGEEITLVARLGYTIEEDAFAGDGGDFQGGQFPDKFNDDMWRIDGAPSASHWTANGNATKPTNWAGTNPHAFGAITYDSGDPKFGIAQGDFWSSWIQQKQPQVYQGETTLETPIFSLENMDAAALEFDQAYNLVAGDYLELKLSKDGGITYSEDLLILAGPVTWDYNHARNNTSDASNYNFETDDSSYDLSAYIGLDNLRVKWTFRGTSDQSVWAVDGIGLPVTPTISEIEWTDGIGNPGEPVLENGEIEVPYTFTPEAPGYHQYGATILVDGCRAYEEDGTALADVYISYAYAGDNVVLTPDECGSDTVQLNAYDNSRTANENFAKGAYVPPTDCETCDDPGTAMAGEWTVVSSSTSCGFIGTFSDVNDPDATFTAEQGTYALRWTLDNGCSSDVDVEITNCGSVDFDGVNDYVDFRDSNYDLTGDFSLEVWVKSEVSNGNIQTIFSKRDANNLTNGYDLRIVNNIVSFRWNVGGNLISPNAIGTDRWYHIAVTHSGTQYRLYIDGVLVRSESGSSPISNSQKAILGAMDQDNNAPNKPVNYFDGWVDELRIWDVGLTEEQVHQNMNQEITEDPANSNLVYGEVVLMDVHGVNWSNLVGYYRMDQISCGYLEPNFGVGPTGKLKNITT
ncbi:LamG-like jellyroll fold domain-containing protein, partial [Urechidicola vernalis]